MKQIDTRNKDLPTRFCKSKSVVGVRTSHDEVAKPDFVLGLEALKS